MKKIFLICGLILMCGTVHAREDWTRIPTPNVWSSESINLSSYVVGVNHGVLISTYPALLHTVSISSAGAGSGVDGLAHLEIYDASSSTTNGNPRKIAYIQTGTQTTYLYDVYCTSGLAAFNQGTTPATLTITYRER